MINPVKTCHQNQIGCFPRKAVSRLQEWSRQATNASYWSFSSFNKRLRSGHDEDWPRPWLVVVVYAAIGSCPFCNENQQNQIIITYGQVHIIGNVTIDSAVPVSVISLKNHNHTSGKEGAPTSVPQCSCLVLCIRYL